MDENVIEESDIIARTYPDVPTEKLGDPKNKKWPLNTPERVLAAIRYYNAGAGKSNYSPEEWRSLGKRIAAASPDHVYDSDSGKIVRKDEKENKSEASLVGNKVDIDVESDEPIFVYSSNMRSLYFKNAVLAAAEVNGNRDQLTEENLVELAKTLPGTPIDIEHIPHKIVGVFTDAHVSQSKLLTNGVIWVKRFPDHAQKVINGKYKLSITASAKVARCSICNNEFRNASEYCEHLRNRFSTNAIRSFSGMKAEGGALTTNPAGTNTGFDSSQIYLVASHNEKTERRANMSDELNNEIAKLRQEIADLQAKVEAQIEENQELKKELETKTAELEAARQQLEEVKLEARRKSIGDAIGDDEWDKIKNAVMNMDEDQFEIFAGLIKGRTQAGNGKVIPVNVEASNKSDTKPNDIRVVI